MNTHVQVTSYPRNAAEPSDWSAPSIRVEGRYSWVGQQPCLGEGQRLQCCKRLGPCSGLPQYSGAGRRQNEGLSPRAGIVHVSCVTRWGKERAGKLRGKHVHISLCILQSVVKLMRGLLFCMMRQVRVWSTDI